MTNAARLASLAEARRNCEKSGNAEWYAKHSDNIATIMDEAPSGSGIDRGISFDMDASGNGKLVFHTAFHHMDENGFYAGWTDHTITVRPGFHYPSATVSGRNRNEIKDYLAEVLLYWLAQDASI